MLALIAQRSRSLERRLKLAALTPTAVDSPTSRLDTWSRVLGGDATPHRLVRRLQWASITPEIAALALDPQLDTPTSGQPEPEWLPLLHRYTQITQTSTREDLYRTGQVRFGGQADKTPFVELWTPWVVMATESLVDSWKAVHAGPSLRQSLERNLLAELSTLSEAAAYDLFDKARPSNCGPGTKFYSAFIDRVLEDPLGSLYGHYPVLARQTCERILQWCRATILLLEAVARDLEALGVHFGNGREPGDLLSVSRALSDRHFGGRSVHRLHFDSGLEVIYKPRELRIEAALAEFLSWASDAGLRWAPPAARVLEGENYGWMECLTGANLDSKEELEDYHRRSGSLAAIGWLLRGRDLHAENVIASPRGPIIVDAEMLLQPHRVRFVSGEAEMPARAGGDHCLATGLLTQLLPGGREESSLGGLRLSNRKLPRRFRRAVNQDGMRIHIDSEETAPLVNLPSLRGEPTGPMKFADAMAEGFEETYRFFLKHRRLLLDPKGPLSGFSKAQVRVLLRGSQEYGRLLQLQSTARNQRSGLAGSWLIEALHRPWLDSPERPLTWPLAGAEREALEQGDVPWFGLPAGERDLLITGSCDPVEGFFSKSGVEAVCGLLDSLDEPDLRDQLERLRTSLTEPRQTIESPKEAGFDEGRKQAAQSIESSLIRTIDLPSWRALEGGGLGTGLEGIAFCLAAPSRDSSQTVEARDRTLKRLRRELEQSSPAGSLLTGGLRLWALSWVSRWRAEKNEPEWTLAAHRLAERLSEAELDQASFDLDSGLAGALLGLLAWSDVENKPETLATAQHLGHHLVKRQETHGEDRGGFPNRLGLMQCGWAHGASGAARALTALYTAVGDGQFLQAAKEALEFEDRKLDPTRANWPIEVVERGSGQRQKRWMSSWCRGSVGMALPRLPGSIAAGDEVIIQSRQLLDQISAQPLQDTDHFCCGNFGRSAVLLTAAQRSADREERALRLEQARRVAAEATDRARMKGFFALGEGRYSLASHRSGLLKGISGIRYQLLRLNNRSLPDLAVFELPRELDRRRNA